MKIFIDTGAFIALTDRDDMHHDRAALFYKTMKAKGVHFITSNFVVCETMNYLGARISHSVAVLFRENLSKSALIEVVGINASMEIAAFGIFKKFADKSFSFTDCTSFAVMKFLKIRQAFAFDKHFEQYGEITRLP